MGPSQEDGCDHVLEYILLVSCPILSLLLVCCVVRSFMKLYMCVSRPDTLPHHRLQSSGVKPINHQSIHGLASETLAQIKVDFQFPKVMKS